MHNTTLLGIPIPDSGDVADVPTHISGIMTPLERRTVVPIANAAARPSGANLVEGIAVYELDSNLVWVYDGTRWITPGVALCTSGTRPSSPYRGQVIQETDTGNLLTYYGATSGWRPSWDKPWGRLGHAIDSSDRLGFAANQEISAACRTAFSTPTGANRWVKVTVSMLLGLSTGGDGGYTLELRDNGVAVRRIGQQNTISGGGNSITASAILTPAAGNHSYSLWIAHVSYTAGTLNVLNATMPLNITVEDMGPVSGSSWPAS